MNLFKKIGLNLAVLLGCVGIIQGLSLVFVLTTVVKMGVCLGVGCYLYTPILNYVEKKLGVQ